MSHSTSFREQFQHSLAESCGLTPQDTLLVALSGGPDSVALLHLLLACGHKCIAAHCNFNLRGNESEGDELFVTALCEEWKVELLKANFNTKKHAQTNKISIEMAARELRYGWFDELLKTTDATLVATGHHGNDSIETFFLNLSRGTGIKGLTGIAARNNNIIRPLLFASSTQINQYCRDNKLSFRIDSSNQESDYKRNKIRNTIVPIFEELNPSFFDTMQNNISYLSEVYSIFSNELERVRKSIVAESNDSLLIPIKMLNTHPQKGSILFEILQPYSFQGSTVSSILKSMNGNPGKQFFSPSHRVVIDRYNLILVPLTAQDKNRYAIEADQTRIDKPIDLLLRSFQKPADYIFPRDASVAHLDADYIEFPLFIRRALPGDRFKPLGMQHFKKISDFFVDQKMSLVDKENTWILTNGCDILWIIGQRIDERYKITPATKQILEIKILTKTLIVLSTD